MNKGVSAAEKARHWSEDPYWTDALDRYYKLRESGRARIELDLDAIEEIIVNGDGPAYRLMTAMQSVAELEGMDGYRGAPRLILALLGRLQEISQTSMSSN